jgi:rubrerythrin
MLEHAILRDLFEELCETSRQASEAYESLSSRLTDPAVREQIEHVQRDKDRHVYLAERLLEIVQ